MAAFKVTFKPSVERDLATLSRDVVARVLQRIEVLQEHPFPRQALKLEDPKACIGSEWAIIGSFTAWTALGSKLSSIHVRHRREVYRGLS